MLKRDYVGKRATLRREFKTRGGDVYPAGSLWGIVATWRGKFTLQLVEDIWKPLHMRRTIRMVRVDDFVLSE